MLRPECNLNNPQTRELIKSRINGLTADTRPRWGKMNSAQMLRHCSLILGVACGEVRLPSPPWFIRIIGIITRLELRLFNNGIPPCMPTFQAVVVDENCNFETARNRLLTAIDNYEDVLMCGRLPQEHALFGKMTVDDWGFLEYKHIHHHLKQFNN